MFNNNKDYNLSYSFTDYDIEKNDNIINLQSKNIIKTNTSIIEVIPPKYTHSLNTNILIIIKILIIMLYNI